MKKALKYIALFVFMASNGASAITQYIAWRNTVVEYNAYFQAVIAVLILGYFFHEIDLAMSAKMKKKWTPKPSMVRRSVQG